ncbi:hypothetical protein OHA72_56920 [Dactylosporangium sp. NBC_01737]|uniref:hypothetical protein n=1 Tax=Dactylosporangium sp. NBC_01737 TaxID=2975959 RepID=UPI002E0E2C99|nr:hypothetical protein OHA72_56920 [Dactylosporangium sp. NBC_01737]
MSETIGLPLLSGDYTLFGVAVVVAGTAIISAGTDLLLHSYTVLGAAGVVGGIAVICGGITIPYRIGAIAKARDG